MFRSHNHCQCDGSRRAIKTEKHEAMKLLKSRYGRAPPSATDHSGNLNKAAQLRFEPPYTRCLSSVSIGPDTEERVVAHIRDTVFVNWGLSWNSLVSLYESTSETPLNVIATDVTDVSPSAFEELRGAKYVQGEAAFQLCQLRRFSCSNVS